MFTSQQILLLSICPTKTESNFSLPNFRKISSRTMPPGTAFLGELCSDTDVPLSSARERETYSHIAKGAGSKMLEKFAELHDMLDSHKVSKESPWMILELLFRYSKSDSTYVHFEIPGSDLGLAFVCRKEGHTEKWLVLDIGGGKSLSARNPLLLNPDFRHLLALYKAEIVDAFN